MPVCGDGYYIETSKYFFGGNDEQSPVGIIFVGIQVRTGF